ncbi:MAG TPA: cytochrome c biogenesis protein CcdA [Candidatus Andersenbacteria bacterium]|nr:cytochrome c biogenesis protein CcdA [Candidatus Andersenbacteria bacterium]
MVSVSLWIAFIGGLVSFFAPCVLPIIPGFLAYIAGAGTKTPSRKEMLINSIFFVLGFSILFALLGVLLNTVLAFIAPNIQVWLSRIGGLFIIFFGLYLTKLIRVPFLERDHKFAVHSFSSRYITSFLFGAAFAAGWTPCVGAALGAILTLAVTQPGQSFALLLAYSLGLGIPFIVVGLFAAQAQVFVNKYAGKFEILSIIFGILLIILGILVFTQSLSLIANWSLLNSVLLQQ